MKEIIELYGTTALGMVAMIFCVALVLGLVLGPVKVMIAMWGLMYF